MAAASLLALIDDIAALLDDVALLTKVAAKQTSGVIGDDLALNAAQASGVHADRELPVVWAVAKGSLMNKVILVPAALAISALAPRAILPLLMVGGLFLCYEGFEKLAHKWLHRAEEDRQHHSDLVAAVVNPAVDLVAFEQEKIKGAVRTDFILSAEIVVISLGTMATASLRQQAVAMSLVAVAVTIGVYGLVAGIVKLDDLGLALHRRPGDGASAALRRRLGAIILRGAPLLMRTLSVVGTIAMFTVGGSIIAHGATGLEHALDRVHELLGEVNPVIRWVAMAALDALVGVLAGGLVLAIVAVGKRGVHAFR